MSLYCKPFLFLRTQRRICPFLKPSISFRFNHIQISRPFPFLTMTAYCLIQISLIFGPSIFEIMVLNLWAIFELTGAHHLKWVLVFLVLAPVGVVRGYRRASGNFRWIVECLGGLLFLPLFWRPFSTRTVPLFHVWVEFFVDRPPGVGGRFWILRAFWVQFSVPGIAFS